MNPNVFGIPGENDGGISYLLEISTLRRAGSFGLPVPVEKE
jgi:hypothetical protein